METCSRLIMIGSTGRNSGKTFLAAELIRRLGGAAAALKVTGIGRRGAACPRGGAGCGACLIDGDFCLEEEVSGSGTDGGAKDTALLRSAGASPVFWLRCRRTALVRGFAAFMERCGGEAPIICESNSLREVVEPAFFIMIRNSGDERPKISAERVMASADIVLQSPVSANNIDELLKLLSKKGFHFVNPSDTL